jgi:hypothetical protein
MVISGTIKTAFFRLFSWREKDTQERFFYTIFFTVFVAILPAVLVFMIFVFMILRLGVNLPPLIYLSFNLVGTGLSLAAYLIFMLSGCRRSRDIGWSPWLGLLLIVPIVNIVLLLLFLFRRGATASAAHKSAQ